MCKGNIKTALVSFEVAKLAGNLGFDGKCKSLYRELNNVVTSTYIRGIMVSLKNIPTLDDGSNFYLRPTQYQLANWIEDNYDRKISVLWQSTVKAYAALIDDRIVFVNGNCNYQKKVEAMEDGLLELLANL